MSDWESVFSGDIPWNELQAIIDARIHAGLIEFMQTLLADPDLSDTRRAECWPSVRRTSVSRPARYSNRHGVTFSSPQRRPERSSDDGDSSMHG
jgi:hypothetical protein